MPKRTRDYHAWLLKRLLEPREAERYLKVAMADSQEMFLKALRNVAEANKMAKVAEEAGVNRESLYKALSEEGNPRFSTLESVLNVLGMDLTVTLKQAVPHQSEPSPVTTESEEDASVRINFDTGNALRSANLQPSNNILVFELAKPSPSGANNYRRDEQDAAMESLPAPYMIEATVSEYLLQRQLAGRA